jgi:hypothetical protein
MSQENKKQFFLYIIAAFMVIIYIAHIQLTKLENKIRTIPVYGEQQTGLQIKNVDLKSLSLVLKNTTVPLDINKNQGNIESAFLPPPSLLVPAKKPIPEPKITPVIQAPKIELITQEEPEIKEIPKPNHLKIAKQRLNIQALALNGAFVGNHFVKVGEDIVNYPIFIENKAPQYIKLSKVSIVNMTITLFYDGDSLTYPVRG